MKASNLISPLRSAAVAGVLLAFGCDRYSPTVDSRPAPALRLTPLTNMIPIKAGSFIRLKQRVTLTRDYWMGKYEITQAEYLALTGKNPSHFPGDPERPVEKISHIDATAFCALLTQRERAAGRLDADHEYRLPTEAEWEHACRAGTTNFFSFGDANEAAEPYAWTDENSQAMTHPVGRKQPNPWGLHDMHGNVWEWCADWYADYPAGDVTDPMGPPTGKYKVFRGGGWDKEAKFARASNRFMMSPSNGIYFVGFRLALAPVQK